MDARFPFFYPKKEQFYITDSYVSVPPALYVTDTGNNVWTFGFKTAHPEDSPYGEFAFNVLRNGKDTGHIASRIEIRGSRVRVLTKKGWTYIK